MGLCDPGYETESKSQAPFRVSTALLRGHPVESLEDVRGVLFGDAASGIFYVDLDRVLEAPQGDVHLPARRRELYSVGQEIGKHPFDLYAIDFGRTLRRKIGRKLDMRAFSRNLKLFDNVANHGCQVEPGLL